MDPNPPVVTLSSNPTPTSSGGPTVTFNPSSLPSSASRKDVTTGNQVVPEHPLAPVRSEVLPVLYSISAKEPFTSLPIVHHVLVRPNAPTHLGTAQSTAASAHPALVHLPYSHLLTLLPLRGFVAIAPLGSLNAKVPSSLDFSSRYSLVRSTSSSSGASSFLPTLQLNLRVHAAIDTRRHVPSAAPPPGFHVPTQQPVPALTPAEDPRTDILLRFFRIIDWQQQRGFIKLSPWVIKLNSSSVNSRFYLRK
ncbi:MAG: hypothetical protein BYD32DRAFT_447596 [Podila humilis]|nr:MAG: hypothetical protein BYD32DRAFT_447596 [Podila humilis]